MLRIIFAGTPELACSSLERLCAGKKSHNFAIVGVLTQADKMHGRKHSLQPSPIKAKALELGINPEHIFAPEKLGPELRSQIATLEPDLLVVFAYGKIFRPKFLDLFPLGGINLHPSALPQWRGPSPIEAQLCAGSKELGITVQRISAEMDAGDIVIQKQFPLPELADYHSATEIAAREGAELLYQSCCQIAALNPAVRQTWPETLPKKPQPQDHSKATYCSLICKQDGRIDWQQNSMSSALQIARNCRAYAAWPKIYSYFPTPSTTKNMQNTKNIETVQILAAREWQPNSEEQQILKRLLARHSALQAGTLLALHPEAGLLLLCTEGILAVQKLQRQNRKAVSAKEFANQLQALKQPHSASSPVLPKWQQLESLPEQQTLYSFTSEGPET